MKSKIKNLGILTGGGDCPGLNAAIRGVIRKGYTSGLKVYGICNGWEGLMQEKIMPLNINMISGLQQRGGSLLGTSRFNPLATPDGLNTIISNLEKHSIDALITLGGRNTLKVAEKLSDNGVKLVGIPKTIENEIVGTDISIGFETAVNVATQTIDQIHNTARSSNKNFIVEVVGRQTGWVATFSGLAGGADAILIPERPFSFSKLNSLLEKRYRRGKSYSIIVIATGATIRSDDTDEEQVFTSSSRVDPFGNVRLGGIANFLANEIENKTGLETRSTALGYIQRGADPIAADRIMASRLSVAAVEMALDGLFGKMASINGGKIVEVPIKDLENQVKYVSSELYSTASLFFG